MSSYASPVDAPYVLGTLPPSLIAVISQNSHSVVAYLSADLPQLNTAPDADKGTTKTTHRQDEKVFRYAVFEDAGTLRRWTVELTSSSSPTTKASSWSVSAATADQLKLPNRVNSDSSSTGDATTLISLTGARYVMKQNTWRESTMLTPSTVSAETASAASVVGEPHAKTQQKTTHSAADAFVTELSKDNGPTSALQTANDGGGGGPTSASSAPGEPTSSTNGLSFQGLKTQHSALLHLLVQTLAPQRMTVPFVVRRVCTVSGAAAPGSPHWCEVDGENTTASSAPATPRRYSEADVAAAVELITDPHPRQPKQRELKSEAYLLLNLEGFADGEARHRAANRAYPALAQHWPASAELLDALERYVDREVVLETRKRHPELTAHVDRKKRRKRERSHSSSGTDSTSRGGNSDNEGEGEVASATAVETLKDAPLPPDTLPQTQPPPSSSQQQQQQQQRLEQRTAPKAFQALHEYPQSLERGDLRTWCDGAEAASVRACLQAATKLTQQSASSAVTLSPLPITNDADVAVFRGQYDTLAAAEEAMERCLRDYRDTVRELKAWYREEQCTPQFQAELQGWVQTQEESRVVLTGLYEKVHVARYRLERDLTDYLHLRALRVL